MSRYTRTPVTSGFEVQSQLNQNFSDIQEAIDDTLSRVGDQPNFMEADLDMNSKRIYNLPHATSNTEPITYAQWIGSAGSTTVSGFFKWTAVATASQTLFSGITPTYTPGSNNIDVYINGVYQHPGAYTETSGSSITFSSGLDAGDAVLVNIKAVDALDTLSTVARVERKIATASQTLFTLTTLTYNIGANNLTVYVNGLRMVAGVDYTETSSSSVTFTSGLTLNDEVVFVTGEVTNSSLISDASGITYQYSTTSSSRTVKSKLQEFVSVKDFGALGDGSTDDTAAILAATAASSQVYFPAGTYITGKITLASDVNIVGAGRVSTVIKLKSGTNDHVFYVSGDKKVSISHLKIDGNYVGNPTLAPNYPCGILCPFGSLSVHDCHITNVRNHAIHTGNTDYGFDTTKYAHDCYITNNLIEQLTATEALGDCIRIHRTRRFICSDNVCVGGLSGIRSNYYCDHGTISNNVVKDSYADVGVTSALSTDMVVDGNICTGHFQHGIEVDSVYRGVISNNVCTGNDKYGIFLSEYGPPAGASYSGFMDGASVSNPTVLTNADLVVSGNTCASNNFAGMACIGQERITVSSNLFSNNNTGNNGGSYDTGIYIDGGTLNKDDVLLTDNTFNNIGYQVRSAIQANAQFTTRVNGNYHSKGTKQFSYGVRGTRRNNLSEDPYILQTTNLTGTAMAMVEDTTSVTGWARQINDTNAAGTIAAGVKIPNVSRYGEKLVVWRFRNVDTMTSCDLFINLYLGGAFVTTAYSSSRTGLGTGWVEVVARLPASLSSNNYDNIDVGITTNSGLTGKINVEEVSCYLPVEC